MISTSRIFLLALYALIAFLTSLLVGAAGTQGVRDALSTGLLVGVASVVSALIYGEVPTRSQVRANLNLEVSRPLYFFGQQVETYAYEHEERLRVQQNMTTLNFGLSLVASLLVSCLFHRMILSFSVPMIFLRLALMSLPFVAVVSQTRLLLFLCFQSVFWNLLFADNVSFVQMFGVGLWILLNFLALLATQLYEHVQLVSNSDSCDVIFFFQLRARMGQALGSGGTLIALLLMFHFLIPKPPSPNDVSKKVSQKAAALVVDLAGSKWMKSAGSPLDAARKGREGTTPGNSKQGMSARLVPPKIPFNLLGELKIDPSLV